MGVQPFHINQYVASGNLVGLIYSYQEPIDPAAGDYYEVVFAPTRQAYLNKIVNGVRYRMASATHNVGPNTWFDVELIRSSLDTMFAAGGINTTVKGERQNDLRSNFAGAVWVRSRRRDHSLGTGTL